MMERIVDESSSVRVLCGLSNAFMTPEPAHHHHENTEAVQSLPAEVVFGRPGAAQILTQLVSWLGSLGRTSMVGPPSSVCDGSRLA